MKVSRRDHKHLNNPFPSGPRTLGFMQGSLFSHYSILPDREFQIGEEFRLVWSARFGGCVSVFHNKEPERALWATIPGDAFVSGAFADSHVKESRGSFVISDHGAFSCNHQTVEEFRLMEPSGIIRQIEKDRMNRSCHEEVESEDGFLEDITATRSPVLLIRGCLYSIRALAEEQFEHFLQEPRSLSGPFYQISELKCHAPELNAPLIAARYWVFFSQKTEHQLGFHVVLGRASQQHDGIHHHSVAFSRFGGKLRKWQYKLLYDRMRGFVKLGSRKSEKGRKIDVKKEGSGMIKLINDLNRVFITYRSEDDEKFFGFGEQFSHMEFKGKRVPIFVQEQGLGRGDQPITLAANFISYRSGGDWSTTYAPSPFYMTSKMKSLYLEGYDYSVFDLTKPDRVQIQVNNHSMQGRILHGNSPLTIIENYTETIGRMPELPKWIMSGAIVGMQGGTDAVRRVWRQLREIDVPISAFWLQDWVGQRKTPIGSQLWWNWEVDTSTYHGWQQLIKDLMSHNIRTMTYCNPCLALIDEKPYKKRNLFDEADKLGLFVKDGSGRSYVFPNTCFDVGMLDLTNPSTVDWFKQILSEMVDEGVRGWMADFGEGLPLDAQLYSGEDPVSAHNRYPELWAKINKEFVDERKSMKRGKRKEDPEDQLVFFMRAGFRNSPRWATLFWEGDQMVSWQRNDGIKSAVVGLLSGGLSGFTLNHSDIGGYCTVSIPFVKYQRSEELLLRWMELNAFNTVFRTHEGSKPSSNVQFYSTSSTLSHFARFAKVYKAWQFYRIQLVKEASEKGFPVLRHLFLHYPSDPHVLTLTWEQFLVGSEILIVPVLDKGRKAVKVYFPVAANCDWVHVWTGMMYNDSSFGSGCGKQGFEAWVDAPIGYPAVFVKAGSVVGEEFMKNLKDLKLL